MESCKRGARMKGVRGGGGGGQGLARERETCHSLTPCHLHKQTYITGRQAASYVFPFMFPHARSHKPVSLVSRAVQSFTVAGSVPALTTVLLPAVESVPPLALYLINKSAVRSVFLEVRTRPRAEKFSL